MATQRWGQRELADPKRQCHRWFWLRGHWLRLPQANPSPIQEAGLPGWCGWGLAINFAIGWLWIELAQGSAMDPRAIVMPALQDIESVAFSAQERPPNRV